MPIREIHLILSIALALSPLVAEEGGKHLELLEQNGIAPDTPGVIAYLQRLQPSPDLQAEIAQVIRGLADSAFGMRQEAYRKMTGYGEAARELLVEAAASNDPEMKWQAKKLLLRLDSGDEAALRQAITLAALEVLRSRRDPGATPVILATLALLDDDYASDLAAAALWASVDATQIDAIETALEHRKVEVRAAALVALELAAGEKAVERIAPMLKSDVPMLRLAASRALIDRLPREAVKTLVEIAGDEGSELAWKADALLEMKTGEEINPGNDQNLGDAWAQWAANSLASAELGTPLGIRRLDPGAGRNALEEDFTREVASLDKGYGPFRYEADNDGPAKVTGGALRIDGKNDEGDQRFYISSKRMIGSIRWPKHVEVRARLQAEPGNNFGYHIGVSVGRIKTLFHPGISGGGFRAETTDDHDYLFSNERMSFEPAAGVTHEMVIRVTKTGTGADFDVTVNGGQGGKPHQKKFSATDKELGDYNRIGLERSGRTGGDALFESLSIRLGH